MGTRTMRSTLIVSLALVATGMAGGVAAEEISGDYHETFTVGPGARLVLKHGDGDVSITPWSKDILDVEVRYRAKATNIGWVKSTDFTVEFRQDGNTVHVIGHEPKRVNVGISSYREYEYTYTVKAPDSLELSLAGEDGDVEIADWRGSIDLEIEDGDVRLEDIDAPRTELVLEDGDLEIDGFRGELMVDCEDGDVEIFDCSSNRGRIRAEDGDLTLDRCQGDFEISLADGDARLSELTARNVEIRSGDGTVYLSLLPADGLDLNVRAADGDVVLDLEGGISAAFELETRDGRIRVGAVDMSDLVKEQHRVTGTLGDGQGSIYVRSIDGSVTMRQ